MEVMILAGLNGTASKIFGITLVIVMLILPVILIRLTNLKEKRDEFSCTYCSGIEDIKFQDGP